MIRAYDDNGNVVDLVEWEEQIRAEALDELVKMACEYYTSQEHSGYYADTNNLIKRKIADWADTIKERHR